MTLENTLVGYADDSILLANCDLARIGDWWEFLVNPIKTKALVISRSKTNARIFPSSCWMVLW